MIRTRIIAALVILCLATLAPGRTLAQAPDRPSLELSLDEAVERALKGNADLLVEKYRPELSAQDERAAKGAYDPQLTARLDRASRTDPPRNAFAGGAKVTNKFWDYNFGGSALFKSGGRLSVDFVNSKTETNSVFSTFDPSYSSTLTANFSQPLLRNRTIDSARQSLRVAKNNREISDVQFRQIVTNVVANVKGLYYNIIAASDNLDAQRKSLALAKKLLDENQIKVRVGTLAPLDVVAAESEVAGRDETVIVAEAAVAQAEDALKQAIFPRNDPATWALRIIPKDRPTAERHAVDTEAAVQTALDKRTDIAAARKSLENSDIVSSFAKSQTLPGLDFVASYGATGLGGTQLVRDGLGGPVVDQVPGGYGDAIGDVLGRDFPSWMLGVSFSYPVFNRQAKAQAARARLSRDQALASLNRLEIQIAAEVRTAARAVETNFKRVLSTRAARTLQERRLDAEEKKFAAGMSTNFLVTQAQRDLADASVAEIRAILDYRKSLIEFDRVQQAGLGSGVVFAASSAGGQ